jgi:hypothetical protein
MEFINYLRTIDHGVVGQQFQSGAHSHLAIVKYVVERVVTIMV